MSKIAILGCGAMGTAIGAYLAKAGLVVDMIDANHAHVDALNKKGAQVIGREAFTVPVKAILPEQMAPHYDLVFLMTKQTVNKAVLENLLPHLGPESVVCTLQNGVPEPFVAQYVGAERTVGGTMHWGATFEGPGITHVTSNLKHKHENDLVFFSVGEINGSVTPRIEKIAEVLSRMGKTVVTPALMSARWRKLSYNCCGSGMSAVCGCSYSNYLNNTRAMECLSYIGYEIGLCAKAEGIDLDEHLEAALPNPERCRKLFYSVYSHAPDGKASMLQDLEAGRKTEVDMLNGYICAVGDKHGIDTPYNDALVSIVHRIEQGELPLSMDNLQYFPNISY